MCSQPNVMDGNRCRLMVVGPAGARLPLLLRATSDATGYSCDVRVFSDTRYSELQEALRRPIYGRSSVDEPIASGAPTLKVYNSLISDKHSDYLVRTFAAGKEHSPVGRSWC